MKQEERDRLMAPHLVAMSQAEAAEKRQEREDEARREDRFEARLMRLKREGHVLKTVADHVADQEPGERAEEREREQARQAKVEARRFADFQSGRQPRAVDEVLAWYASTDAIDTA